MLSIVIPTHESERPLVRTLAALVSGAAAGAVREVIVADAGSRDATLAVADFAGCQVLLTQEPLGLRLKAAAAAARAAWLLFLRPGTRLDATWVDDTMGFVAANERNNNPVARAAVFRPTSDAAAARPVLIEALWLLRLSLGGRPQPEQGLLIAKRLYEEIGGHRDHAYAEADLLRRLGRRRLVMLRSGAVVD
jgi:glycosyltransferase involved in cell wall biosynthesis